jgi:hypothetical protein
MIARLDNPNKPSKGENVAYSNKGSVARLKNYLIQNKDKYDSSDLFFTATKNNMPADEFYKMIDTNVKGLGRDEHKFYSFTINPSGEELSFIHSDKEKLKEFVRAAMADFHTAHKTIKESDQLVWAAIIHDNRLYTEDDIKRVKQNNEENSKAENSKIKMSDIKLGEIKKGENTHIHIVLSARDAAQKKTITVLSPKNKVSRNFELGSFQRNNQRLFQEMFNYKKGENIYGNVQENYIKKKIEQLDKVHYKTYELSDIKKSGDKMDWSSRFTINLSNMFREAHIEKQIVLQPNVYLEQGRKYYNENLPQAKASVGEVKSSYVFKDNISSYHAAADNILSMLASEGNKQETKGYDLIKKPKKKNRPGLGKGFSM